MSVYLQFYGIVNLKMTYELRLTILGISTTLLFFFMAVFLYYVECLIQFHQFENDERLQVNTHIIRRQY